jgi:hypothetical protein
MEEWDKKIKHHEAQTGPALVPPLPSTSVLPFTSGKLSGF